MNTQIPFSGLSDNPNDYLAPNGALEDGNNFKVTTQGIEGYTPFAPVKEYYKEENKPPLFVHDYGILKNEPNFLFVDGGRLYYKKKAKKKPIPISDIDSTILSIHAIGNTLVLLMEGDCVQYLLWNKDEYVYLGDGIPMVDIHFTLCPTGDEKSNAIKITISKKEMGIAGDTEKKDPAEEMLSPDNTNKVRGALNKLLHDKVTMENKFVYPFFLRYALRMYDGSTLTAHSAPILLSPQNIGVPMQNFSAKDNRDDEKEVSGSFSICPSQLVYAAEKGTKEKLSKYADLVKSVDVFVSPAIYEYKADGAVKFKIMDYKYIRQNGYLPTHAYRKESNDYQAFKPYPYTQDGHAVPYFDLGFLDVDERTEKFLQASALQYKIASIPIQGLHEAKISSKENLRFDKILNFISDNFEELPIKKAVLSTLVHQEQLTDFYADAFRLSAREAFFYNNYLHLSDVSAKLFEGYPESNQLPFMFSDELKESHEESIFYPDDVEVYVQLLSKGKYYMARTYEKSMSAPAFKRFQEYGMRTFLYYPSPDAINMKIRHNKEIRQYEMIAHPYLHGAYALNGLMVRNNVVSTLDELNIPQNKTNVFVPRFGELFTSEFNNPFVFPSTHVNRLPVNKILKVVSNTTALSEGQFGEHPLYAFTDDGIWALSIGRDGSIVAKQPISRKVCYHTPSIVQLDDAISFVADRGVYLLNGANTTLISPSLGNDNDSAFVQWIQKAHAAYDYKQQELILFQEGNKQFYVCDLRSLQWSKAELHNKTTQENNTFCSVLNHYPDQWISVNNGEVLNVSERNTDVTIGGNVTTRPFRIEADRLFTLNNLMIRGYMQKNNIESIEVEASHDSFRWKKIIAIQNGNNIRRICGSPYRYYRLKIAFCMSPHRSLHHLDLDFTPKWGERLR